MEEDIEKNSIGYGLTKLACAIGGLGCLVVSVWMWNTGHHQWWVIALGLLGAFEAL